MKILISDGYASLREFLKSFVAKMPETRFAEKALTARKRPTRRRPKPDLVAMDIEMPRMDGLETTRQIQARSH